jgi:hypothetical protein
LAHQPEVGLDDFSSTTRIVAGQIAEAMLAEEMLAKTNRARRGKIRRARLKIQGSSGPINQRETAGIQ